MQKKKTNKYALLSMLLVALLLSAACRHGSPRQSEADEQPTDSSLTSSSFILKGDSTLYGLACEGSNDTVLVFLPDSGGDPVSYDILQARMERRVKGRIKTGDNLALLLTDDSLRQVRSLIDIDVLKGAWAYQVMPQPKARLQNRPAPKDGPSQARRDSMMKRFMVSPQVCVTQNVVVWDRKIESLNTRSLCPRRRTLPYRHWASRRGLPG